MQSPRRTYFFVVLVGAIAFISFFSFRVGSDAESQPSNWSLPSLPRLRFEYDTPSAGYQVCNPYDRPGYLQWTEGAQTAKWVTFPAGDSTCTPAPDYFLQAREALANLPPPPEPGTGTDASFEDYAMAEERKAEALESVSFLRGKSILLLGDSVDRNALVQMSGLLGAKAWVSDYHNASFVGVAEGWDIRGAPHILEKSELDFRIYSNFFYGMDDVDEFRWQQDWRPPGKAETRVEELFGPFMQSTGSMPDLIQLHSGMWDLALWGRQDTKEDASTNALLTEERSQWWRARMTSTVASLRETFPGVPIWLRLSHRVATMPISSSQDYAGGIGNHKVQNYFTDKRTHQFRDLQRSVAQELCIPVFDFGHIWEGYQEYQDKVHPLMFPGSLAYGMPLLHALWMETQGRQSWAEKPCKSNYLP